MLWIFFFLIFFSIQYPDWGITVGWSVAVASFVPIPVALLLVLLWNRFNLKKSFYPTEEWLPANEADVQNYRNRWYRKKTGNDVYSVLPGLNDDDIFCDSFLSSKERQETLFQGRRQGAFPSVPSTEELQSSFAYFHHNNNNTSNNMPSSSTVIRSDLYFNNNNNNSNVVANTSL